MEQQRRSNIELLRIFAMLGIVAHHFCAHSGFDFPAADISVNRLWIDLMLMGGKLGVDVFVLISGYFLIGSKRFKTVKALNIWGQLAFYSLGIYLVFILAGKAEFGFRAFLEYLFPVTSSQWWFASCYFLLLLVSPFLNRLLNGLDKKSYQALLLLVLTLWCFIPTLTGRSLESNFLVWFICLYALGGYIRLWKDDLDGCWRYLAAALAFAVLTFGSVVIFDVLGRENSFFASRAIYFYNAQYVPFLVISLCLLLGFKNLKIAYSPVINAISSATFGVYLIHDNDLLRPFLWKSLLHGADYWESPYLIFYTVAAVAVVYAACTVIDLIRKNTVEKAYIKLTSKAALKIEALADKILSSKIFDKL